MNLFFESLPWRGSELLEWCAESPAPTGERVVQLRVRWAKGGVATVRFRGCENASDTMQLSLPDLITAAQVMDHSWASSADESSTGRDRAAHLLMRRYRLTTRTCPDGIEVRASSLEILTEFARKQRAS